MTTRRQARNAPSVGPQPGIDFKRPVKTLEERLERQEGLARTTRECVYRQAVAQDTRIARLGRRTASSWPGVAAGTIRGPFDQLEQR